MDIKNVNYYFKQDIQQEKIPSVVDRLDNVPLIISMLAHSLNNIYSLQIKVALSPHNIQVMKSATHNEDLIYKNIEKVSQGMIMKLMKFRRPDNIYIGETSNHNMGDFIIHGKSWGYTIT